MLFPGLQRPLEGAEYHAFSSCNSEVVHAIQRLSIMQTLQAVCPPQNVFQYALNNAQTTLELVCLPDSLDSPSDPHNGPQTREQYGASG
jgi:hypothetical protein